VAVLLLILPFVLLAGLVRLLPPWPADQVHPRVSSFLRSRS
jgi:hypothetical protein